VAPVFLLRHATIPIVREIQRGFQLYDSAAWASGILRASGKRRVLESHPEAFYHASIGRSPLPKPTLEGRLQRQLVLHERGVRIRDPMLFYEEVTRHRLLQGVLPVEMVLQTDELDALAAALTAWLVAHQPESIAWVGDPAEGTIAVPTPCCPAA
jgi:hypothetical protein